MISDDESDSETTCSFNLNHFVSEKKTNGANKKFHSNENYDSTWTKPRKRLSLDCSMERILNNTRAIGNQETNKNSHEIKIEKDIPEAEALCLIKRRKSKRINTNRYNQINPVIPRIQNFCNVCQINVASGLHYGVYCCNSCNKFFQRSLSTKKALHHTEECISR